MATAVLLDTAAADNLERVPAVSEHESARERSDLNVLVYETQKKLRFEDVPWANTKKIDILTGAERDVAIAKDITELIGESL